MDNQLIKIYIKKKLIKVLDPFAKKLGYNKNVKSEQRFHKNTLLDTLFLNFKKTGFIPNHIIDVGANHGTWTREALKQFPETYVTLVEPQHWLKPSFQDIIELNPKIAFLPVGVGAKEGIFKFTIVNRDDSCSFRYTEEQASKEGYKQVEIQVTTLNDIVQKSNFPFPDLVKIDAEGMDIEVLKGAESLFGRTEVFMVEAAVCNKTFDNTVLKMLNFMDKKGYRLFEITDLNRPFTPNVLWLVELAFIKKGGIVDSFNISYTI